jgi:lantibiotic transport system permease protein
MQLIYSVQAELIKTKRSASSWLCIIGGLFLPTIFMIAQFKNGAMLMREIPGQNNWKHFYFELSQNMSIFLLPMGLILASSLITQMEFKNNAWKQLHTTPQKYLTIYSSKIIVVITMALKYFLFFNLGVLLSGIIPCLILEGKFPSSSFPLGFILEENFKSFVTCLPILAFQFVISLRFKNFLVAVGIGLAGIIGTFTAIKLEGFWGWISPYVYTIRYAIPKFQSQMNLYYYASLSFFILIVSGYFIYVSQKQKG